jgi:hypothetical protein
MSIFYLLHYTNYVLLSVNLMWKMVACCEVCAYIFALLQKSATAVYSNMLECVKYTEMILDASERTSTGNMRVPVSG